MVTKTTTVLVLFWVALLVGGTGSAGERRLTLKVEAKGKVSPMAEMLVQSKLLRKLKGYDVLASQPGLPMGISGEPVADEAAAIAQANRTDVVVELSTEPIPGGVEVTIEALASDSGKTIATVRESARGDTKRPGMKNRLLEKAIEQAMPRIIEALDQHRKAPPAEGQVSPIDFSKVKPPKKSKAGKTR